MNTITFVLLGLVMSVSVGALLALILTSGMNDGILRVIIAIIISLVVGFGFIFCMKEYREHEEKKWNNGFCTACNTEWHFQSAAKGKNSTIYYYVCDNGHIFKTDCFFQK